MREERFLAIEQDREFMSVKCMIGKSYFDSEICWCFRFGIDRGNGLLAKFLKKFVYITSLRTSLHICILRQYHVETGLSREVTTKASSVFYMVPQLTYSLFREGYTDAF